MRLCQFNNYLLVLLLFAGSCSFGDKSIRPNNNIHEYIFLGHIYQNDKRVDNRVANLNISAYDQIWLGGDVCAETTADEKTITHINDLFDLSSPTTHWSLGNHDVRNGNINFITEATNRPTFYATYFDGVTLLILNTNFYPGGAYDKNALKSQFELINNVCDTILDSSHLILISHHAVWNNIDHINNMQDIANGDLSNFLFSTDPKLKYVDGVYPLLKKVQQKGVKVIHIAGDFGQKVTRYKYLSSDSIQFIGSGITSNIAYHSKFPTSESIDLYLVFHHDVSNQTITWTFEELK